MAIQKQTAMDIALAYREVEMAQKLLADIEKERVGNGVPEVRDAFGRMTGGLELGVPSSHDSRRLFNVPWTLARPIIEAHIATQSALIETLSAKAAIEMQAPSKGEDSF